MYRIPFAAARVRIGSTRLQIAPSLQSVYVSSATQRRLSAAPFSSTAPNTSSTTPATKPYPTLLEGVLAGDRLSLSRAITLAESRLPSHEAQARALMEACEVYKRARRAKMAQHVHTNPSSTDSSSTPEAEDRSLRQHRALRVGISGPPGVGKSTFIECFGAYLLSLGHRLAVLTIDPSSHVSGGSILGDKTRMLELSRSPNAYVRPSPSRCVLGGVGTNTYDAILLCEAAGFDLIFVETVGVGQSEVSVADMVDMMLLLVQPGGGDELQGMKKGIVELIDLIVVNKADGPLLANARHTKLEYMHALQLNTRRKKETDWKPPVKLCSSVSQSSIAQAEYNLSTEKAPREEQAVQTQQQQLRDIWKSMCAFEAWSKSPLGDYYVKRIKQSQALVAQALQDDLSARLNRSLDSLNSYQKLQQRWNNQESVANLAHRSNDGTATAASNPTENEEELTVDVVPRAAAAKVVDEFLATSAATSKPN